MKLIDTRIPDVKIIEPAVFGDARGFFMESWHAGKFAELGLNLSFVQDNHSRSRQGILRGLHYQTEQAQGKLVRVTSGKVFDVAVDLRRSSPTFGQWVGAELSDENYHMLWVPPGFAHGFYVMSASAEFLYKCTDFYTPQHEHCIRWDDPTLAIDWPLANGQPPLVSGKDAQGKSWQEAITFP
ncbi:MAG TPA: dTDP-4-dehydrorhamnose 3,5-epimerase [Candidatus Thiothrix moscowensis]|uniref:dTDP-4-dehydrorhamnose 3,5-epimerase n=1 Tax=unclassified Thiothrix TaxID=2636184 RepID=UPI0025E110C7|nr:MULTISPECIES: dTDP-4-dehydrorhamnose 3,5-epimerase [unclassified Thiothrix]HRJ54336.1 dTDP-4-dehydrorhamnose 3,5-epimerase [Candidatus Thiothrix moscowensis]HRJ94589.1 dTDP-4-dehydrorhamnose 3,5-epimerase [Candidatus Thiothrix moscowensis]